MKHVLKRMRNRKGNKLRRDDRGTTLVEMIVSFVLISLFMVAASKVIANTVIIYYQAKGISTGMQVSNIINKKLVSVVEGAMPSPLDTDDTTSILMADGGIELTDRGGNHIRIDAVDPDDANADGSPKYMEIYYFPVETEAEEGSGGTPANSGNTDTTWAFDAKAYMGYHVKELNFEKAGEEYRDNILKMTLVLDSPQYGEYATTSYIECYNFNRPEYSDRIKQKP